MDRPGSVPHAVEPFDQDGATDAGEETAPFCQTCGQPVGIFVGPGPGWRHYRGEEPGGPFEVFDPGHDRVITSWPLQVRGTASRDTAALMAVAADIPPVRITSADLAYAPDAHAGLATATFTPNPSDSTSAFVTIAYADGIQEDASMMNMIAMGGPSGLGEV